MARRKVPVSPQLLLRTDAVGRMTLRSQVRNAWSSATESLPEGRISWAAKTKPGPARPMISDVWHEPLSVQVFWVVLVFCTQAMMKSRDFCAYFTSPVILYASASP